MSNMSLVPMVIKRTSDGERSMDLYSRLLDERIIMVNEGFNDEMAGSIVAQLLYLQSEDSEKDITMYINSPGGAIVSMWSIIDTINIINPDVVTICTGMAASAGSALLAAGAKGKRMILPHAKVMIHQPMGGAQGQISDMEITIKEALREKKSLTQFLADRCDKSFKQLDKDMDRDNYMDAEAALKYGIVDKILKANPAKTR